MITEQQKANLELGRQKGLVRNRPSGLKYNITKTNPSWFKKGNKPWTTGKKLPFTIWNKGTKGVMKVNSGSFTSEMVIGENNNKWKGDDVGYWGIHTWVERTLGKPMACSECGVTGGNRYHWHNISNEYKRDVTDWVRLCPKCHKSKHRKLKKEDIEVILNSTLPPKELAEIYAVYPATIRNIKKRGY